MDKIIKNRFITFGFLTSLFLLIINYLIPQFCNQDIFCIYKFGDGLVENLFYFSLVFLVASLISLIRNRKKVWVSVFVFLVLVTMLIPQTCSGVVCVSRDMLLVFSSAVSLFFAFVTNLYGKS